MNAEHEHVTVNLPPPYYTHSTADTWHPTLVPKNSGFGEMIEYSQGSAMGPMAIGQW